MNKKIQINVFLIIAGVIAIGAGAFMTIIGRGQVARDTEPATATVLEYVEQTTTDMDTHTDQTLYYPVMSYEVNGETIESQYNQGDYAEIYQVGDQVDIKYDPENPEEFIVADDAAALSSGGIWEIPLGVVLIVAGIGKTVLDNRKKRG